MLLRILIITRIIVSIPDVDLRIKYDLTTQ